MFARFSRDYELQLNADLLEDFEWLDKIREHPERYHAELKLVEISDKGRVIVTREMPLQFA